MYNGCFVCIWVYPDHTAIAGSSIEHVIIRRKRNKVHVLVAVWNSMGRCELGIALTRIPSLPRVKGEKHIHNGFMRSGQHTGFTVYGQTIGIYETGSGIFYVVKGRHNIMLLVNTSHAK